MSRLNHPTPDARFDPGLPPEILAEAEAEPAPSPKPTSIPSATRPRLVSDDPETNNNRSLFDRPATAEYLQEWTERLAQIPQREDEDKRSMILFRLGDEWLALNTAVLAEVTHLHPIHSIPHRSGEVLLGLVNVRGQLRIAISLHGLLGVESGLPPEVRSRQRSVKNGKSILPTGRMAILQDRLQQWVFYAEEVVGIQRIKTSRLRKVPSTFGQSSSYCQSVFDWEGHTVGCLDEVRLLSALRSLCQ